LNIIKIDMKIFLDFDDVLFDTYRFKQKLWAIFMSCGFSRKETEKAAEDISSECFKEKGKIYSPLGHIRNLKKIRNFDDRNLKKEIDGFLAKLSGFVFADCRKFLESFPKNDLYLISYGHGNFQRKKIRGSGLFKYFKKIIIIDGNKVRKVAETAKKEGFLGQKKIILIDDRPENLKKPREIKKQVITLWLRRPEGRYSNSSCFYRGWEARNLKEALEIIKREKMK